MSISHMREFPDWELDNIKTQLKRICPLSSFLAEPLFTHALEEQCLLRGIDLILHAPMHQVVERVSGLLDHPLVSRLSLGTLLDTLLRQHLLLYGLKIALERLPQDCLLGLFDLLEQKWNAHPEFLMLLAIFVQSKNAP